MLLGNVSIEIVVVLVLYYKRSPCVCGTCCETRSAALCCATMPASTVIRAAFFALGTAVGGGAVAAINASRKKEALVRPTAATASTTQTNGNVPLVEVVGVTGDPRLSQAAAGPVLKYGNPGMYDTLMATIFVTKTNKIGRFSMCQAPFSTNLCAGRMSQDTIVACGILHGSVSVQSPCSPSLSCPLSAEQEIFTFFSSRRPNT